MLGQLYFSILVPASYSTIALFFCYNVNCFSNTVQLQCSVVCPHSNQYPAVLR